MRMYIGQIADIKWLNFIKQFSIPRHHHHHPCKVFQTAVNFAMKFLRCNISLIGKSVNDSCLLFLRHCIWCLYLSITRFFKTCNEKFSSRYRGSRCFLLSYIFRNLYQFYHLPHGLHNKNYITPLLGMWKQNVQCSSGWWEALIVKLQHLKTKSATNTQARDQCQFGFLSVRGFVPDLKSSIKELNFRENTTLKYNKSYWKFFVYCGLIIFPSTSSR